MTRAAQAAAEAEEKKPPGRHQQINAMEEAIACGLPNFSRAIRSSRNNSSGSCGLAFGSRPSAALICLPARYIHQHGLGSPKG
jgi:hypothetical protein